MTSRFPREGGPAFAGESVRTRARLGRAALRAAWAVAWLACTPAGVLAAEAREGPVAAWDFKTVEGDRVPDVSGNGHEGVSRGAKFVRIPPGIALSVGQEGGHVSVPAHPRLVFSDVVSVEAWVSPLEIRHAEKILSLTGPTDHHGFWLDLVNEGVFSLAVGGGSAEQSKRIYDRNRAGLECWHHVVGVFDHGEMLLYVNGQLRARGQGPRQIAGTEGRPLFIGCHRGATSYPWHGIIDYVALYARPVGPEEVRERFAQGQRVRGARLVARDVKVDLIDQVIRAGQATALRVVLRNETDRSLDGVLHWRVWQKDGTVLEEAAGSKLHLEPQCRIAAGAEIGSKQAGEYWVKLWWNDQERFVPSGILLVLTRRQPLPVREIRPDDWRPLDEIDCSKEYPPGRYCASPGAAVVDSPLGRYRQTSGRRQDRFAYRFSVEHMGRPHLLVFEYPDDRKRSMGVMNGTDSDLSDGVLTGGFFYPVSHSLVKDSILFWPRKVDSAVMFMDWADGAPSAVSRIRLYELRGELGRPALHEPPGDSRLMGHQWEDPNVEWSYGSTRLAEQAISETVFFGGLEHIAQYLSHTGQNVWKYPIIWYWGPHYPSHEEPPYRMGAEGGPDWVQVLLTLFEDYRLSYYPSVTLLRLGSLMNEAVIDEEAVRRGADTYNMVLKSGGVRCSTNDWTRENDPERAYPPGPIFNPVHPRVQKRILAVVREIVDRYGSSPALRGLSFNMWVTCILWFHSLDNGYDDYTVGLFERETGTRVPVDAKAADRFGKRHAYLTTTARNQWIEWRCRKVHQLLMEIRDVLRNRRPDLRLGISCWPWYVRTNDRPPGEPQQMGRCPDTYELLRAGGLDLKMFLGEPNVDLELQFTPQHDRVWDKPHQDPAVATYRDFDFLDDGTYAIFRRGGRSGVWMYNGYFETFQIQKPLPGWWFGEEMLNHPGLLPTGKYFMEHYAQALAAMDVKCLTRGGVGMSTIGHDADVRDFARAFRAMPAGPFEDVPADSDLVVARQLRTNGMHYLYLVNRHNVDLTAAVFFSVPPVGLRDLGSGEPIAAHGGELTVRLPAFSLRSFAMPSGVVAVERCAVDLPRELMDRIESAAARLREFRKRAPLGTSKEAADRLLADFEQALRARRHFRAYHLLQSYDALRSAAWR